MDVTGADLLPVLAANRHGTFGSFLRHHEALLDPPRARFGAVRPGGPWLHPAT